MRECLSHTGCRRRFTLVELLVVISIIAVLAALLLPSLIRAKQYAEMVTCASNLRQYGVLAFMWQDDREAIMPAWYYRNHPDGKVETEPWYTGGPGNIDVSYYTFAPVMLADEGYAAKESVSAQSASYGEMDAAARRDIFMCPSSFTPGWNVSNNRFWDANGAGPNIKMPMDQIQQRNNWTYRYGSLTGVKCEFCPTGQTRGNRSSYGKSVTSYGVNNQAGGDHQYKGIPKVNSGYYKRKNWYTTDPSRIGYIFESNLTVVTANHFNTFFSLSINNYGLGGVTYGPPTRHLSLSTGNFIYADGHRGTLRNHYYDGVNREPFPFLWE